MTMTRHLLDRRLRRPRPGAAALIACFIGAALLLGACSNSDETSPQDAAAESNDEDNQSTDKAAGTATALVDGREFTFDLTRCTMHEEREVEISGLGGETSSDIPSFLDGGAMEMDSNPLGEFRIDIGSDGPFDSSDEFISLGAPTGGDFTVVKDGDGYLATGNVRDHNGTDLGTGTLRFTCN